LPQNLKEEALGIGYQANDIVGFKINDKNGTILTKNVRISPGQLEILNGMVIEMPAPWHNEERMGEIRSIWKESKDDWNPEFFFTLISVDGKAEKTFPGYYLLNCKLRPDLKSEPLQDGNYLGKVVEIWYQWHGEDKVGIVTAFKIEGPGCVFTLKSLDSQEEKSFETTNRKEIKIVAKSVEEYKQKK